MMRVPPLNSMLNVLTVNEGSGKKKRVYQRFLLLFYDLCITVEKVNMQWWRLAMIECLELSFSGLS